MIGLWFFTAVLCGGKNVKIFFKNIAFALIIKEPQQNFQVFNTY
jgi:hypothetical protein